MAGAGRNAILGAAAGLFGLAGCATMTPAECLSADWRAIGYEDGLQGHERAMLANHRQACAKAGVAPDFDAYHAGRDDGIRVFCRPANGFRVGRAGIAYLGVCPAHLEGAFLAEYDAGAVIFDMESAVSEVLREIASLEYRMEEAENDIARAERTLAGDDLEADRRKAIRQDVKVLSRDIGRMSAERDQLLVELAIREERLREHLRP